MAIRHFQQQGQGYGLVPSNVTLSLDGTVIYAGPVESFDDPLPAVTDVVICNYDLPADFVGTKTMTITVADATLWLADTVSDRYSVETPLDLVTLNFFQVMDGISLNDPLTNVTINGIEQTRTNDPPGQWYWKIDPGQTFQCTVNIPAAACTYDDWSPAETYAPNQGVIYGNASYMSGAVGAAAGLIPPDNPQYWIKLPVPVWDLNTSYVIYDRVVTSAQPPQQGYMALQNVPAGTPLSNTEYWQPKT